MHRQTTNEVMTESCQLSWVFDTGHRAPSLEGYLLTRVAHDAIVVSPGHFLTGGSSTGRDDRLNSHLAPVAQDHRVELKPDKRSGVKLPPSMAVARVAPRTPSSLATWPRTLVPAGMATRSYAYTSSASVAVTF